MKNNLDRLGGDTANVETLPRQDVRVPPRIPQHDGIDDGFDNVNHRSIST